MFNIKAKETELKIVPDTSVLISGIISDLVSKEEITTATIIIPEFVVEELRSQASRGREIGFKGLGEIKKIRETKGIELRKSGRRQTYDEIKLAKYGRIDALIIDVAIEEKATLFTSDMVQALVAEVEGVKTRYFKPYEKETETKLAKLLTSDTLSLHLKENTAPLAKRGKPGDVTLVKIGEKMSSDELEQIIKEIMTAARYEDDSFVEASDHVASVVMLNDMRIAITRPPFSDSVEVTVVRPIAKLSIDDYEMSDKLRHRIEKAEGILIAGAPGSGKSTFAAAIAEYYEKKGKIVKTMESPRDLQVGPEITQYTKLRGSFENTADILLLVRPDYTIFDEVRKTEEFRVFSDMRLAGIGMLGVVHATNPVDAVHRFIGRIELGMVPHITDTVIFIKDGKINKVYFLALVVRTPTGMTEADLARPLVEIRDFESGNLEYEIYTYGEENVIVPVTEKKESGIFRLAKKQILTDIRRFDPDASVDILSDNKILVTVDNSVVPRIIGKEGMTVKSLEKELGVSIEVSPRVSTFRKEIEFSKDETGGYMVFSFREKHGKNVNFYSQDSFLFAAIIGKDGKIKVSKKSDIGRQIVQALIKNTLKAFI